MPNGYQLKITIKGSHPPIWRRVIVPERITFYQLDDIIEELFGWTHSHLFEFYIKKFNVRFVNDEMCGGFDEEDAEECMDSWIEEGDTFEYTYDFGDNWEHTIKFEKIVEYPHRYPTVLKYKGANMIEDCGGILGYEEWKDKAEPFDMEQVNQTFATWDIPIAELSEDSFSLEEEDEEFSLTDIFGELGDNWEEDLEEMLQKEQHIEASYREYIDKMASLKDVFSKYKKDELQDMAEVIGLTNYGKWRKNQLVEELTKTLLETDYMQHMLKHIEKEELETFEDAINEDGICISKELLELSLFLSCYGVYVRGADFYYIPLDVQERYQQVMTPKLRKSLEERFEFENICDSAIYLYGVISLSKFTEIHNLYAQIALSEKEVLKKLKNYAKANDDIVIRDDYLMSEMLEEFEFYKHVLECQKGIEHYLPEEKEEFLVYGQEDAQPIAEDTEFFVDYLEKTLQMPYPEAVMFFYMLQEMIRMNQEDEELMNVFTEKLTSPKAWKKADNILSKFIKSIRKWEFCGHSFYEVHGHNKIVEFQTNNKVYPNEPCPCGSGRKYKHCCGRK